MQWKAVGFSFFFFLRLNELGLGRKKERKNGVQADKCIYVGGNTDGINYGTKAVRARG